MKIPVENEMEVVRCVTVVNLNPQKGTTLFEKTGFNAPLIRRVVPCDLDAIELPNLKKMGQEALDAAKNFGPLQIKKPTSSCREYREELINWCEKLFTGEGLKYIDTEGLLNIARGFTGYGFSPSEAIRYTLYKMSLPYHTVGWLKPEWIYNSCRENPRIGVRKPLALEQATEKVSLKATKKGFEEVQEKIRVATEFVPEYEKLIASVKIKIKNLQTLPDEVFQFLQPEEKEHIIKTHDALKVLEEHFGEIPKGNHWEDLKTFEVAVSKVDKCWYQPSKEMIKRALGKFIIQEMIKGLKNSPILKKDRLDKEEWNLVKRTNQLIIRLVAMDILTKEQGKVIIGHLPTPSVEYRGTEVKVSLIDKAISELINKVASYFRSRRNFRKPKQNLPRLGNIYQETKGKACPVKKRPIGTAELFHSTLQKWVRAEIWRKKYDSLTNERRYLVTWKENGKERSGWVVEDQLRNISHFSR